MTSNTRSTISLPPGMTVRMIRPADDEPVRAVFAAAQEEVFLGPGASDELRHGVREWVDRVMAADMAQPSRYYSAPGKGFWVAEAEDGGIAATASFGDSKTPRAGPASLRIGRDETPDQPGGPPTAVDEVAVYDRALDATQVAAHWRAGRAAGAL